MKGSLFALLIFNAYQSDFKYFVLFRGQNGLSLWREAPHCKL